MFVLSLLFKILEVWNFFSFVRYGRYGELKKLIMKGVFFDVWDEMGNLVFIIVC